MQKICTNPCFCEKEQSVKADSSDDADSVSDDYRNEMNAIEIYKKKLLSKKQSKERFLTQLLSFILTVYIPNLIINRKYINYIIYINLFIYIISIL